MTDLQLRLVGPKDGQSLREDGLDRVTARNEDWLQWMRNVARRISRERGYVTSDDMHEWAMAWNREPTHHNAYGAIFRRGSGWTKVGYIASRRPKAHGRMIRKWFWKGDKP